MDGEKKITERDAEQMRLFLRAQTPAERAVLYSELRQVLAEKKEDR